MTGGFSALVVSQLATPQAQQQHSKPALTPLILPQQSRKATRAQQLQQQSLNQRSSSPSPAKQQQQQQAPQQQHQKQQQPQPQQQQQQQAPQEPALEFGGDVSPTARSRSSSPAPGTPTQGELRGSGGAKKALWEAAGALCSPTFRGRMAPGIMASTGVHQVRKAHPHSNSRHNKDLMMAEDAVDSALDLYRSRVLPNLGAEPAYFAALHPEAVRSACHDYMDNVVHVGDVNIVTDKYRELKGLCEEEYDILSQRVAAEARTAAARAHKQGIAALANKFVQQRRASVSGGVSMSSVAAELAMGGLGSMGGLGGSRPRAPSLSTSVEMASNGAPPSPWGAMRGSLQVVTESGRGGSSRISVTGAGPLSLSVGNSPSKHAYPVPHGARHAPASPDSDAELKLPAINRAQLNTGTIKFIDEAPPTLCSNQSVTTQLAFTGIRSADPSTSASGVGAGTGFGTAVPRPPSGGQRRDRSVSDFGLASLSHTASHTLSPALHTSHTSLAPGLASPSSPMSSYKLPSALLSALYPSATSPTSSAAAAAAAAAAAGGAAGASTPRAHHGGAGAGEARVAPAAAEVYSPSAYGSGAAQGASDRAGSPPVTSEKVGALLSAWERATGPQAPTHKPGVMAAYHVPHDTVVRLHFVREGTAL